MSKEFDKQISHIKRLEDKAQKLSDDAKVLREEADKLKYDLLKAMDEAGTDQVRNRTHTASVSEQTVPTLSDFDAFWKWARRMNKPYLLMKRINPAPWRAEVEARKGKPLPGVKSYVKRTLSIKKTRTP